MPTSVLNIITLQHQLLKDQSTQILKNNNIHFIEKYTVMYYFDVMLFSAASPLLAQLV